MRRLRLRHPARGELLLRERRPPVPCGLHPHLDRAPRGLRQGLLYPGWYRRAQPPERRPHCRLPRGRGPARHPRAGLPGRRCPEGRADHSELHGRRGPHGVEEVLVADSKTYFNRMVVSCCAPRTLTRWRTGATGDAGVVLVQGARRES